MVQEFRLRLAGKTTVVRQTEQSNPREPTTALKSVGTEWTLDVEGPALKAPEEEGPEDSGKAGVMLRKTGSMDGMATSGVSQAAAQRQRALTGRGAG